MSEERKISGVIITFNEEKNIGRCLKSLLPVCDEVIVVDSFSTDNTQLICEKYSVKFIQHPFEGHIQQKNYALQAASNDLILSLDADEELSHELQQSILEIKKAGKSSAYRLNRLTSYCGKWIRHCGWYPDRKIRLWDRQIGRWGGINPHDTVVLDENVTAVNLSGDMLHYTYHTIGEHITQMNKFSDIAAREAYKRNKKVFPLWHLGFYPAFTFFRNYILKAGILDGYYGFIVCKYSAYYRFLKYSKLAELHKGKEI